jgi:hypothetical protein
MEVKILNIFEPSMIIKQGGVEEIQLGVVINRYQWTVLAVDNIEVNTLYITCPIGQYWRKFYIPPPSIIYDDLVERLLLFTQMVLDWLV